MESPSFRARLRAIPVFGETLPEFDSATAPDDPQQLFVDWLEAAIRAEVPVPHAMSIATADTAGNPSVRTLLLKDVDDRGVWFASSTSSPKGRDLESNPAAALVFFWRELGRQVRITGNVSRGPREDSEADFLQRHPNARVDAIAGVQSRPLPAAAERTELIEAARRLVQAEPDFVPEHWSSYVVVPESVEFWQAAQEREVSRLRYERRDGLWIRESLWP